MVQLVLPPRGPSAGHQHALESIAVTRLDLPREIHLAAATLREEVVDDEKIGDVAQATDPAPVHQAGGRGGRGLWRRRWHDDGR